VPGEESERAAADVTRCPCFAICGARDFLFRGRMFSTLSPRANFFLRAALAIGSGLLIAGLL
jgi:hypothetical protein